MTEDLTPGGDSLVESTKDPSGSPLTRSISRNNYTKKKFRVKATPGDPQGTTAVPDIQAMVTGVYRTTMQRFPDGASEGIYNYKLHVPDNLHATPVLKIRFKVLTLGVVSPAKETRWELKGVGIADTENADVALTAETAVDETMPITTESYAFVTITISSITLAEGDEFHFQLKRLSNHANDTFTDAVGVTEVYLEGFEVAA